MFAVKKGTVIEVYCPHGHQTDLLDPSRPIKFCHTCGTLLKQRQIRYDAPYCADCDSPVDPCWDYCSYCGQEREGNHAYSRNIRYPADATTR